MFLSFVLRRKESVCALEKEFQNKSISLTETHGRFNARSLLFLAFPYGYSLPSLQPSCPVSRLPTHRHPSQVNCPIWQPLQPMELLILQQG